MWKRHYDLITIDRTVGNSDNHLSIGHITALNKEPKSKNMTYFIVRDNFAQEITEQQYALLLCESDANLFAEYWFWIAKLNDVEPDPKTDSKTDTSNKPDLGKMFDNKVHGKTTQLLKKICDPETVYKQTKTQELHHLPPRCTIKKVIFNYPATVVIFQDGHKVVTKCKSSDLFDEEKGLALALVRNIYGDYAYSNVIRKWCKGKTKTPQISCDGKVKMTKPDKENKK